MALRKCKECGHQVSTKAKNCTNCGAPVKTQISTGIGCLIIILFLIAISGLFSSIDRGSSIPSKKTIKSADWRTTEDKSMAYIMMEKYVEQRLISPKSAEFPGVFDGKLDHVQYLGNQKYRIVSYVDAQNSFGALIRTNFVGEIQQISETTWRLLALDLQQ